MIAISSAQIGKELYKAIQKDQANRYNLLKDWTLPKLAIAVPDYHGGLLKIVDGVITVKAYTGDVCNGCSLSPDEIGSWNMVVGALFHDPWYSELDAIADAWNWPAKAVRKLGDEIFACILVATGTPRWLARAYLTGLRAGGGIVHFLSKAFGKAIMLSIIAGWACGCGCQIPNHFDDQPVTPPTYEDANDAE